MRYRTDALAAIHETMTALHEIGAIDDKTMRRFDKACLRPDLPLKRKRSNPSSKLNKPARPSLPASLT